VNRSVLVKYDGLTFNSKRDDARRRTVNVAILRLPELDGATQAFEKWELEDRLANLRQFGYAHLTESAVLQDWPKHGVDRSKEEATHG